MPRFRLRQVLLYNELLHVLYISRDIIKSYDGLSFEEAFKKFMLSCSLNLCQMNDRLGERYYNNTEMWLGVTS